RAGRCEGCRLELSGSEKARVRSAPPDEVVRCDECGRILVRTAESGL
ncbi:MAG TPA: C4-type zinc ribbon domain-containing protein, partial [Micromonosporaceae bacterium]|nr:C4-type zinc ribbon domain-containing protein [Micromonosporaceae bacterium]